MRGLTLHKRTDTNDLHLSIPDDLKGVDLQIIILPVEKADASIEFFTVEELKQLSLVQQGGPLPLDDEDYAKW